MVFDVVLDMVSSNLHDGHEGNHRLREANKDTAKRVAFYSRQLLSAIKTLSAITGMPVLLLSVSISAHDYFYGSNGSRMVRMARMQITQRLTRSTGVLSEERVNNFPHLEPVSTLECLYQWHIKSEPVHRVISLLETLQSRNALFVPVHLS